MSLSNEFKSNIIKLESQLIGDFTNVIKYLNLDPCDKHISNIKIKVDEQLLINRNKNYDNRKILIKLKKYLKSKLKVNQVYDLILGKLDCKLKALNKLDFISAINYDYQITSIIINKFDYFSKKDPKLINLFKDVPKSNFIFSDYKINKDKLIITIYINNFINIYSSNNQAFILSRIKEECIRCLFNIYFSDYFNLNVFNKHVNFLAKNYAYASTFYFNKLIKDFDRCEYIFKYLQLLDKVNDELYYSLNLIDSKICDSSFINKNYYDLKDKEISFLNICKKDLTREKSKKIAKINDAKLNYDLSINLVNSDLKIYFIKSKTKFNIDLNENFKINVNDKSKTIKISENFFNNNNSKQNNIIKIYFVEGIINKISLQTTNSCLILIDKDQKLKANEFNAKTINGNIKSNISFLNGNIETTNGTIDIITKLKGDSLINYYSLNGTINFKFVDYKKIICNGLIINKCYNNRNVVNLKGSSLNGEVNII